MRVLVDLNILLDFLTGRPGHGEAKKILHLIDSREITGVLCGHELPTLAYFLEREKESPPKIKELLKHFCWLFEVVDLTLPLIERTLNGPVDDFEDGLIAEAARSSGCKVILTRNLRDFKKSPVPAQAPKPFLKPLA